MRSLKLRDPATPLGARILAVESFVRPYIWRGTAQNRLAEAVARAQR